MSAFETYRNPAPMYRGTDFWMLNDRLEDDEIVRQLHEMKKQGVYSFIARTYIGLKSDYPGKDFKAKLHLMVKTADELGMKLFLQAGYMPEAVLDLPPEYALNYLRISRKGTPLPLQDTVLTEHGDYVISQYNSGTFLDMFNHNSVAFYIRQSYAEVWKEFEPDFGKGILSVWVDEPSYGAIHLPFPLGFAEKFKARWGYDILPKLYTLYLDEDDYETVRYHFRKLCQDELENNYFRMIREWCNEHNLWASGHLMCEDSLQMQITRAGATMPFYRFFDMPGIDVLCANMNWQNSPIKWEDGKYHYRNMMYQTPIQCCSAARQNGQDNVLCEMYGVTSNNFTFRDQKHMFDILAAHGVNHRSVHGIFYSLHGRAKRTYPVQTNYYQPYWDDEHTIYDYVARTSRFVSLGGYEHTERTLVLHPLDSAFCEYTAKSAEAVTGVQQSRFALYRRDNALNALTLSLTLSAVPFDFGDERTLELFGGVQDGLFTVGKMSYTSVVLPNMKEIQATTVALLRRFAEAGGKIFVLGNAPVMLDGYRKENILADIPNIIYLDGTDTNALLPYVLPTEYTLTCAENGQDLLLSHRTDGDTDYWFTVNTNCNAERHAVLNVKGNVSAELWDGWTGNKTAVHAISSGDRTQIFLTLPEGGSLCLVTEKTEKTPAVLPAPKPCTVLPCGEIWKAERADCPNVLLLEYCRYRKGEGEYSAEYPVLAVQSILVGEDYHGEITQKYTFTTDSPLTGLRLALEDAHAHTIRMNGIPVPHTADGYYMAKSFETVALPEAVAGENVIELTRDFKPLEKMKSAITSLFENLGGVELESVYLIGDFAVKTAPKPERNGTLRYSRKMSLTGESGTVFGDFTANGYPFFAGTLNLTQTVTLPQTDGRIFLELDVMNACTVHVLVNGKECGMLAVAPYTLDITQAVGTAQTVEITLAVTNTLRNLLGPYHRPCGEVGSVWGGYGNPDASWVGGDYASRWFEHRTADTDKWTDDYLLVPQGIGGAKIVIK